MNAELLPAGRPATLEPLTCTRDLGDLPVANKPLHRLLRERLEKAGFTLATGLADGAFFREDAWICDADLAAAARTSGPWVLRDADGNRLAWSGPRAYPGAGLPPLPARADSFHLRYPWDLLRLHAQVLGAIDNPLIEGDLHPGSWLTGFLRLGPGSRVLPGVCIEGPVVIGAGCKIGPNCYLRGPVSIGNRCHIGQAVEVKNTIVMSDSNIGHLSYCGDSILGEKVNFGAGTMCANLRHDGQPHRSAVGGVLMDTGLRKLGMICGDGVHTGVNTSIYPGRKLWPNACTKPGEIVQKDLHGPERNAPSG